MSMGKWTNYGILQDSLRSCAFQNLLQCFMKDFSIYNNIIVVLYGIPYTITVSLPFHTSLQL